MKRTKPRKSQPTAAQQREYEIFAMEFPFCWACRERTLPLEVQRTWSLQIALLDIAHIVGGAGRVHERCDWARLCKCCHNLNHGAFIRYNGNQLMPKITRANMLWLKQKFDPDYYDERRLGDLALMRLPEPEELK